YRRLFNADQEWLGRASGGLLVTAISCFIITFIIFAEFIAREDTGGSSSSVPLYWFLLNWVLPIGLIGGFTTAVLVGTCFSRSIENRSYISILQNIVLGVAATTFIGVLIFVLSVGTDNLLFGKTLVNYRSFRIITDEIRDKQQYEAWYDIMRLILVGIVIS